MSDRYTVERPERTGCLSVVGNVLWLVIAGWGLFLSYLVAAVMMAVLIITIPFAVQSLKLAVFSLWPFGREVVADPGRSRGVSAVGNILWLVLCGWWIALGHLVVGLVLCLTIVGIPFGIQCFKLTHLALFPFGKELT